MIKATASSTIGARESLGRAFGRGFALSRFFHHSNHPRHQRLSGAAGRLDVDHRIEVQGSGKDARARLNTERNALAGDRALIDAGLPAADDSVDGNPLRRSNPHDVSGGKLRDGDLLLDISVVDPPSDRRRIVAQRFDCSSRATHREMFKCVTQREEKEQNRSFADPPHQRGPDRREQHEQVDVEDACHQFANGSYGDIGGRRQHREDVQDLCDNLKSKLSDDEP